MSDGEHLRMVIGLAAEATNNLSGRIARQAKDGEPLGELDIINELNRVTQALIHAMDAFDKRGRL